MRKLTMERRRSTIDGKNFGQVNQTYQIIFVYIEQFLSDTGFTGRNQFCFGNVWKLLSRLVIIKPGGKITLNWWNVFITI